MEADRGGGPLARCRRSPQAEARQKKASERGDLPEPDQRNRASKLTADS
jgi:hypothetical protein